MHIFNNRHSRYSSFVLNSLKISLLWLFIVMCSLFREVYEFINPGLVDKLFSEDVPEITVFSSAVFITFLTSLSALNMFLSVRLSCYVNRFGVVLAGFKLLSVTPLDLDDYWFLVVQGYALVIIFFISQPRRKLTK